MCESSRKYNPYFSISLSSGEFHACHLKIERGGGVAGLNDIYRDVQSFAFERGGVYGLDLAPGRQFEEKIRNSLNKQKKNNNIIDTPFEHYYFGCNIVIRESILPDKMTPVLHPIIMNYTLDVSIHDVKRLIDVK